MIKSLQHLAPHGTLAFRFYLPTNYRVIQHNQAFDGFAKIIVQLLNTRRTIRNPETIDKELSMPEKENMIKEKLMSLRQKAEARSLTKEDVEKEIKAHRAGKYQTR